MTETAPGRSTTPPHSAPHERRAGAAERTVPTRRWPRPEPLTVVLLLVWLVGIGVATIVPWQIVPPTADDPDPADVWIAAGVSSLGVLIFAGAGIAEYVRTKNKSVLTWALIPGVAIGAGVLIFTATLLAV